MKKVVLIVLNDFTNDSRVLKEALSLSKNYNVKVVALHNDGLKLKEQIGNVEVERVSLKTRFWPKQKIFQLFKYFEFIYKVVKGFKSYDILHCNDLNTLPIGVLVKVLFNKEVKIVYDAHEWEINQKPNQSKISVKLNYIVEKLLIRYADEVLTVSKRIAQEYTYTYNIDEPKLVLNCPGYKTVEKKNIFRKKFNISSEKKVFLYQGGLSYGRGIELIIEAFVNITESDNVIVFMGYGPLENYINKYVNKYNNIFLHHAVEPQELLEYTSSADFGISFIEGSCLSYEYCLPNKMFEYLMAEIPVIVSNLPEMKEFIKKYKVGTVADANDVGSLVKSINEILLYDDFELKKNILNVKKQYNWEKQEEVLLSTYEGMS
ncbi:glycosyltransferase [Sulfurimonas sp.]|uniref:glycosyltransferase n=1 Tax=Sulfurimonas sp. TaxID=2022749 RepID=UPI003564DBD3